MIPAMLLGASQALTRRLNQEYVNYLDQTSTDAEVQRKKDNAQTMYDNAISSGLTTENGWAVVPNELDGTIKIQAINQYSGKAKDDDDPLPRAQSLAYKAALGIDKSQFADYDFVKITPNIQPTDVKRGYYTVGESRIPIREGIDYMLFESLSSTKDERGEDNIANWITTVKNNADGFQRAVIMAENDNPEALNEILAIGATRAKLWQDKQSGEMAEGKTYFAKDIFGPQGPLRYLKDIEVFQNDFVMGKFAGLAAEKTEPAFLRSLNEIGFNIPINNPTARTLNGEIATVMLDGEWDEYLEQTDEGPVWNQQFANTIGGWADRSSRDQFEWFSILQSSKDPRATFDKLIEFETEMQKLGQPVDFTSGRPEYRRTWSNAVKPKFITLINELSEAGVNLDGGDMTSIIAAMMPEDMYKGLKMQVFSGTQSVHYYVDPGLKIEEANETISTYQSNIALARDILKGIEAGTGLAAEITTFRDGLRDQLRQLQNLFTIGDSDENLREYTGVFRSFFTEDELDPDNLDNLKKDALLLKQRKFFVVQLMYSFAKNMGGTGSDRLSDQDAANALKALGASGLLNTEAGMRIVMNTLVSKMTKRVQILSGLTSQNEREIMAGVFLRDLTSGDHGMSITSAIVEAQNQAFEARIPQVNDPARSTSNRRY